MLALGAALGRVVVPGTTLALHGDLGAGKTVLVKGIGLGLGLDPGRVASPTFPLIQEHNGGRILLVHVDLYRLESDDDVAQLGLEELADGVLAVEWPERGPRHLNADRLRVALTINDDARLMHVMALGPRSGAMLAAWDAETERDSVPDDEEDQT